MTTFHVTHIYKLLLCAAFFTSYSIAQNSHQSPAYTIVFIHLGNTIPSYIPQALEQSRLFNPGANIALIANHHALDSFSYNFDHCSTTTVTCESLQPCREHVYFFEHSKLDTSFREGFWRYAFERFYYLYEFIEQYEKSNVFHLEYDNMLYKDLSLFLPVLSMHYTEKIGAVFDNDQRCIPSFMYIPNKHTMKQFITFITDQLPYGYNDMEVVALFKKHHPSNIQNLPIIPAAYAQKHPLVSPAGHSVQHPEEYSQYEEEFDGIFDAAALGQYLGGIDPRNGASAPGFINESCIFNPARFSFVWKYDEYQRKVPYLYYDECYHSIINLHIHSKALAKFASMQHSSD